MPKTFKWQPVGPIVSNDELQAAFLAARSFGKILDDDVLTAIILAAESARHD